MDRASNPPRATPITRGFLPIAFDVDEARTPASGPTISGSRCGERRPSLQGGPQTTPTAVVRAEGRVSLTARGPCTKRVTLATASQRNHASVGATWKLPPLSNVYPSAMAIAITPAVAASQRG